MTASKAKMMSGVLQVIADIDYQDTELGSNRLIHKLAILDASRLLASIARWQEDQWNEIDFDRDDYGVPKAGSKVLIVVDGVQQDAVFEFLDKLDGEPCWIWFRDDLDQCPAVEEGQFWCYAPVFGNQQ